MSVQAERMYALRGDFNVVNFYKTMFSWSFPLCIW